MDVERVARVAAKVDLVVERAVQVAVRMALVARKAQRAETAQRRVPNARNDRREARSTRIEVLRRTLSGPLADLEPSVLREGPVRRAPSDP
jgi:hypothetical protein